MNTTFVLIGFYALYIAYRYMMLNHPDNLIHQSKKLPLKTTLDIIINGKYYKYRSHWVAEIPAFKLKASHKNPFETLKTLKNLIELDFQTQGSAILIKDDGELLLVLPESPITYDLIAKYLVTDNLSGIQIDDPFKEKS